MELSVFDTGFIALAMFGFAGFMVWAFFLFKPDFAEEKALRAYNWAIMGVAAMICGVLSIKGTVLLKGTQMENFLGFYLLMANLLAIAVVLLIGFLVRNYFIFK